MLASFGFVWLFCCKFTHFIRCRSMYLCRRLKHSVLQHILAHPIHKASVFVIKEICVCCCFLVFVFLYLRHILLRHAAVSPSTMQVSLLSPFCVNCHMLNLSRPGLTLPWVAKNQNMSNTVQTSRVQKHSQKYINTRKKYKCKANEIRIFKPDDI